jgi:hypothetical protein
MDAYTSVNIHSLSDRCYRGALPGVIAGIRVGQFALTGGVREIEERLPGEFRDGWVGMTQKGDQVAKPMQFVGFHTDESDFGHEEPR